METLRLSVPGEERRTDILVGQGILRDLAESVEGLGAGRGFILADSRLRGLRGQVQKQLQKAGWKIAHADLPATEATKDLRRAMALYPKLIRHGMDRDSVLFVIGGGVIGDLGGFVAASYLRGIRWVGIPTTLLAQVDSGVGGKTGVNVPEGKNLVGAFHQPELVVCDTAVLKSLSKRDRVSGLGEMIKYGLILDRKYLDFLRREETAILKLEPRPLSRAIATALSHKIALVAADERERTGARRLLNFGHTIGHALEAATDYRRYRHGEAILWGMRWAVALSVVRGLMAPETGGALDAFLSGLPVPALPERLTVKKLMPYLRRDKKASQGRVPFVLLRDVGSTAIDRDVEESDISVARDLLEER